MEKDEFLRATAPFSSPIGDISNANGQVAPGGAAAPPAGTQPWQTIDVAAYVPVPRWLLKTGSRMVSDWQKEPIWKYQDDELDSFTPALTEATQKCLYDLKLASRASNPYVKLGLVLLTSMGVKGLAIQINRELEKQKREEKERRERENQSSDRRPRPPVEWPTGQPQQRPASPMPPDSLTESTRMEASGGASSFSASQTPASPSSFAVVSEPVDE